MWRRKKQLNLITIGVVEDYLDIDSLKKLCFINKKYTSTILHSTKYHDNFIISHLYKPITISTTLDWIIEKFPRGFHEFLSQFQFISFTLSLETYKTSDTHFSRDFLKRLVSLKLTNFNGVVSIQISELLDSLQHCHQMQKIDLEGSLLLSRFGKKRMFRHILKLIPSISLNTLILRNTECSKSMKKILKKFENESSFCNSSLKIIVYLKHNTSTLDIEQLADGIDNIKFILCGNLWISNVFKLLTDPRFILSSHFIQQVSHKINFSLLSTDLISLIYQLYYFGYVGIQCLSNSSIEFFDLSLQRVLYLEGNMPFKNKFLLPLQELQFNELSLAPFNQRDQRNITFLTNLTSLTLTSSSSVSHDPFFLPSSLQTLVLMNNYIKSFNELPSISSITSLRTLKLYSFTITESMIFPDLSIQNLHFDKCSMRIRRIPQKISLLTNLEATDCPLFLLEHYPSTLRRLSLGDITSLCSNFQPFLLTEINLMNITFNKPIAIPTSLQLFSICSCRTPENWDLIPNYLIQDFHCCNCNSLVELKLPLNIRSLSLINCTSLSLIPNICEISLSKLSISLSTPILSKLKIPVQSPILCFNQNENILNIVTDQN